jgi:hypothetical protein
VGGGFGSNGFVTNTHTFPMDGKYRTYVISDMGHSWSDLIVQLVLRTVCCAIARTLTLYYKALGTTSTLLRIGNILG